MSLEVLLIPLGIAAVAALREARSEDLCEKCRATRVKDQDLLIEALNAMGAEGLRAGPGRVTARTRFGDLTFQQVGDVFLGRVDRNAAATAGMLDELDRAVGAVVQARTVERVRQQAFDMGMVLLEQRQIDGSVQMVFEEVR